MQNNNLLQLINKPKASSNPYNFPEVDEKSKPISNHPDNINFLITTILGHTLERTDKLAEHQIYIDGRPFDFADDLAFLKNEGMRLGLTANKTAYEDCVRELATKNRTENPFAKWVDSKPWDGIDRLELIKNAVRIDSSSESNIRIYNEFLPKWFVGLAASAYTLGNAEHQQMLVLRSADKQGVHKSRFLRSIIPTTRYGSWFTETETIDPKSRDDNWSLLSNILWVVGELDFATTSQDSSILKSFLTKSVSVRRPFFKNVVSGPKICTFVGCTNKKEFLRDRTGNRRFVILDVEYLDENHGVDLQQLYAQLVHMFKGGYRFWLNDEEIAFLNNLNDQDSLIKNSMDMFLEQECADDPDERYQYSGKDLYESYRIWCLDKPVSMIHFCRSLSKRFASKVKSKKKITHYNVMLSHEFPEEEVQPVVKLEPVQPTIKQEATKPSTTSFYSFFTECLSKGDVELKLKAHQLFEVYQNYCETNHLSYDENQVDIDLSELEDNNLIEKCTCGGVTYYLINPVDEVVKMFAVAEGA